MTPSESATALRSSFSSSLTFPGRPTLPSRFLRELPDEGVDGVGPDEREEEALGAFDGSSGAGAGLAVGDLVIHPHFGRGTIEQLAGAGINARAIGWISPGEKRSSAQTLLPSAPG